MADGSWSARVRSARGDIGERDGATWFLASKYPKVDKDEVVIRSNGMPTYFASDIAYHYDKFVVRGFDHVVNIWGVDHQGHVPRMAAVMAALGLDPSRLTIVLHGLVKLIRNGEEVKLSVGINNAFGKEPPICLSCTLNGYDPSTYDLPGGAHYYVRLSVKY